MPDQPVRSFGAPLGTETPGQTTAPRPVARAPTDAEVKAAYQKYMATVVDTAHRHFNDHVAKVRGSSATPGASKAPPIRIEKAIKDAGG